MCVCACVSAILTKANPIPIIIKINEAKTKRFSINEHALLIVQLMSVISSIGKRQKGKRKERKERRRKVKVSSNNNCAGNESIERDRIRFCFVMMVVVVAAMQ